MSAATGGEYTKDVPVPFDLEKLHAHPACTYGGDTRKTAAYMQHAAELIKFFRFEDSETMATTKRHVDLQHGFSPVTRTRCQKERWKSAITSTRAFLRPSKRRSLGRLSGGASDRIGHSALHRALRCCTHGRIKVFNRSSTNQVPVGRRGCDRALLRREVD